MVTDDTPRTALPVVDLATVTPSTFEPYLGQAFNVGEGEAALSLTLTAVDAIPYSPGPGRRAPFALVFSGPRHPMHPQGMYTIEHPGLGRLDLFLVPVAPDAQGARYEAVFS